MVKGIYKPICGLRGVHVVVSEYNDNGKCSCINCNPNICQACSRYKKLQNKSNEQNQIRLERCLACLRQR